MQQLSLQWFVQWLKLVGVATLLGATLKYKIRSTKSEAAQDGEGVQPVVAFISYLAHAFYTWLVYSVQHLKFSLHE